MQLHSGIIMSACVLTPLECRLCTVFISVEVGMYKSVHHLRSLLQALYVHMYIVHSTSSAAVCMSVHSVCVCVCVCVCVLV